MASDYGICLGYDFRLCIQFGFEASVVGFELALVQLWLSIWLWLLIVGFTMALSLWPSMQLRLLFLDLASWCLTV